MPFLPAFDALTNAHQNVEATELLFSWIIHREHELYAELHASRPILRFWSQHPGNPDFHSTDPIEHQRERTPGWVYLLSSREDVQQALDELSMRPYDNWNENTFVREPWLLSFDDLPDHRTLRARMGQAMDDPLLDHKMEHAARLHWREERTNLSQIDVVRYCRRVALSFTGSYFGIPASLIFETAPAPALLFGHSPSGIENLEQWSGEGYESFIWKIHARHFDAPPPGPRNRELAKIGALVFAMMRNPMAGTVIERFQPQSHTEAVFVARNMVGMIQGLIDNMMTSACIALNQIVATDTVDQAANLDIPGLVARIRQLQSAHDAPSPFLPRFGALTNPKTIPSLLDRHPELTDCNLALAIGAAMTDPSHLGTADMRLGYGLHQCIGRELGDTLVAYALQPLLQLRALQTVKPLLRKWGWIPQQYVIGGNHPQRLNQVMVDLVANAAPARPHPYSLWSSRLSGVSNYSSWPSLTNTDYFARHLPPASATYTTHLQNNVPVDNVTSLFERPATGIETDRSTLLFGFFAQWLVDSFLRTHPTDRRKTTSNHQIDLCQIYGLEESTTRILRSGVDGRLRSEVTSKGEFPQRLFDNRGNVRLEFQALPYVANGQLTAIIRDLENGAAKVPDLCVAGLERGNSTVGYTALNTLFLREHNRICGALRQAEGASWDDERLFQTGRMITTVVLIRLIIEEYINHINIDLRQTNPPTSLPPPPYSFDPDFLFAERRKWYRTNWVGVEFDLLYRWHSLVPDSISFNNISYTPGQFRGNNAPLFAHGLNQIFVDASDQEAGRVQLFNSPRFLWPAEREAVKMARNSELAPLNDYRRRFGIPPVRSFADFGRFGPQLEAVYGDVDTVEFLPGIFAEPPLQGTTNLFGPTMMTMVGYDAFTHALTNPLLSQNVLNEEHLTATGMDIIAQPTSLNALLMRNGEAGGASFDVPPATPQP